MITKRFAERQTEINRYQFWSGVERRKEEYYGLRIGQDESWEMNVGVEQKFIAGYCKGEVMVEFGEKEKQKQAVTNRVGSLQLNPSGHPKFQALSSQLLTSEYRAVKDDSFMFHSYCCHESSRYRTPCHMYSACAYGSCFGFCVNTND